MKCPHCNNDIVIDTITLKKAVTPVLKIDDIVIDRAKFDKWLSDRAKKKGVKFYLNHKYMGIAEGKVVFADKKNKVIKKDFDKIIKTTLEIEKKIMEYKMGDNHFFEIFDSRWGIDRHMGNVKECERCDYRRIHEEDQEKYESGEISYNPDESQIMLPGFVYPEKKKDEQLMLRFPAKKRLESAVKIA